QRGRVEIREAFEKNLSVRPRQTFFSRSDVRAAYPLGLIPKGRRELFRWFICVGQIEECLRLEEIWWFFLECAENPGREIARTYLFTPNWQKRYPDGLTVFGQESLAAWLSETYHLNESAKDLFVWPIALTPAEQIRLAYWAREDWRSRFPKPFV